MPRPRCGTDRPHCNDHRAGLAQTAAPGIALPADLTPNTPQPPQVARQKRIDEWLARKQYAQALAELDKDVAAQPRNAQARFQRAVALAGLGRSDDAVVAFSQMTQDFPELPEPYLNLATLYAERGELLRARETLITATRVAPENAQARPTWAISMCGWRRSPTRMRSG